jgi:hypothetical protein
MNIRGFTTQTLIEFHNKIRECLQKDDENPSTEKVYGVRSFKDWRDFSDSIEAELSKRGVQVVKIKW